MNPLTEPFLYDAVTEHQSALRESAGLSAPEPTRRVCVDLRGAPCDGPLPRLWRLLATAR